VLSSTPNGEKKKKGEEKGKKKYDGCGRGQYYSYGKKGKRCKK